MQLRYVSLETLERLGYIEYEEQYEPSPPRTMTTARKQKAAPTPKAREQSAASSRRFPEEIPAPVVTAPTPQVVGEVQVRQTGQPESNRTLTISTGSDRRYCDHEQDFVGQVEHAAEV